MTTPAPSKAASESRGGPGGRQTGRPVGSRGAPRGKRRATRAEARRPPARAPTRRRRRAAPEAGRAAAPLPPRPGLLPPPGAGRRARPPPRRRTPALTHLSFSVPKMEAKYSAISHPPPPPTLLPTPPTLPDARERRHPDATTLVPPPWRGGAAQSDETLPARGRGLARAGGTAPSIWEPSRLPPAPPAGVFWHRVPHGDPGPEQRGAQTAASSPFGWVSGARRGAGTPPFPHLPWGAPPSIEPLLGEDPSSTALVGGASCMGRPCPLPPVSRGAQRWGARPF